MLRVLSGAVCFLVALEVDVISVGAKHSCKMLSRS